MRRGNRRLDLQPELVWRRRLRLRLEVEELHRDCIQKAQAAMQAAKADDPAAILTCLNAEIKRQDSKLVSASQRLSKILPAESRKRLEEVERLAEQMVAEGGDRSSLVVAFGGGIVTDVGGFLASAFMRGIPVP